MRMENLLEVELLPALSLAVERWCQKHPITHGNQGSVKPFGFFPCVYKSWIN